MRSDDFMHSCRCVFIRIFNRIVSAKRRNTIAASGIGQRQRRRLRRLLHPVNVKKTDCGRVGLATGVVQYHSIPTMAAQYFFFSFLSFFFHHEEQLRFLFFFCLFCFFSFLFL